MNYFIELSKECWKIMEQSTPKWQILAVCIALALSVAMVYGQVRSYKFVSFDDYLYVTKNVHVKAGLTPESVRWAFGFADRTYWHPLTWLSHMTDVEFFGLDAGKHHLVSVAIHAANAILLFLALFLMTSALGPSAFVAGLFALHPINVDSVAWIAERKNVLSTFFWMVTLICYVYYTKRPDWRRYCLVALAFLMGLMAKPMLATIPFVLLLLDFWPLGRIDANTTKTLKNDKSIRETPCFEQYNRPVVKCFLEKVPLLAVSLILIVVVSSSLKVAGQLISFVKIPIGLRLENALVSYFRYLGKMLFPHGLTFYYPYPHAVSGILVIGAVFFLMILSIWFFKKRMQKPWLIVGWLWFAGTMAPVTGIIQGGQWPAIAERWAYVPLIGIYILIAWEVSSWKICRDRGRLLAILAIVVLCVYARLSFMQVQHWKDNEALYAHAVAVNPDNPIGQYNLANTLKHKGRLKEAVPHYLEALRVNPRYAEAYINLANLYIEKQEYRKAIPYFKIALKISPGYNNAKANLAKAYRRTGQTDKAIQVYRDILKKRPDDAGVYYKLGNALFSMGDENGAAEAYKKVIRIRPDYASAYNNLGQIMARKGKPGQAEEFWEKTLKIDPTHFNAMINLAMLAQNQNKPREAVKRYREALALKPNSYICAIGIAENLKKMGRVDEALDYYRKAVALNPESGRARRELDAALMDAGK